MVKILQDGIIKGKLKVKFHDKIACKARTIIYYVYRLPATYVKPMKNESTRWSIKFKYTLCKLGSVEVIVALLNMHGATQDK